MTGLVRDAVIAMDAAGKQRGSALSRGRCPASPRSGEPGSMPSGLPAPQKGDESRLGRRSDLCRASGPAAHRGRTHPTGRRRVGRGVPSVAAGANGQAMAMALRPRSTAVGARSVCQALESARPRRRPRIPALTARTGTMRARASAVASQRTAATRALEVAHRHLEAPPATAHPWFHGMSPTVADPSDTDAWNAYLAESNAKQARKRVAADVLLRDPSGRVLLVNLTYKPGWRRRTGHRGVRCAVN